MTDPAQKVSPIPAREVPRIQRALIRFAVLQEEIAEILKLRREFPMSLSARVAVQQSLLAAKKAR